MTARRSTRSDNAAGIHAQLGSVLAHPADRRLAVLHALKRRRFVSGLHPIVGRKGHHPLRGQGAAGKNTFTEANAGQVSNTEAIGRVLYTDYIFFFQAAGLVLLVAMIGAIVLTLRHKSGVKRQNIGAQVARTPAKGMRIVQIKPGQSLESDR